MEATLKNSQFFQHFCPEFSSFFCSCSCLPMILGLPTKVNIALAFANSEVYGGKANGSILAGRNFFGSESLDVGSVLIFGDAPSAGVTRRVMGLLDACYPFAPKAGLLTDEAIGVQGKAKRGTVTLLLLLLLLFFGGEEIHVFFSMCMGCMGFRVMCLLLVANFTSGEMLIQIAIFWTSLLLVGRPWCYTGMRRVASSWYLGYCFKLLWSSTSGPRTASASKTADCENANKA